MRTASQGIGSSSSIRTTWRVVLVVCAAGLVLASMAGAASGGDRLPGPPPGDGYEIWMPDQGTNTMHIYDPSLEEIDRIEFGPEVVRPHMVEFDSEYRYAFVANTVSGNVAVIRTADREVVAVVDTGPGTHMAAVTPDDSAVWVAVIGGQRFVEIPLDLDDPTPTFEIGRVIDTAAALAAGPYAYPSAKAICHQYTADSRYAYLTFGPGPTEGGLVVVDLQNAEIERFYDPSVVKANCGLALSADGETMYANWGGNVGTGEVGEWYAFDTATHELEHTDSSRGLDAHGVRVTPDGRRLWMVNRATSNAIIVDTRTNRVVRELPFVGKSPDILDFSPDGRHAFVTLRGPNPLSGPHTIAGDTPGFGVLHVPSGRLLTVVQQPAQYDAGGGLKNDPHGIAVRILP